MNASMQNIKLKQGSVNVSYSYEVNGETFDGVDSVDVTPQFAAMLQRQLRYKHQSASRTASAGIWGRVLTGSHQDDYPQLQESDWHPVNGTPLN